MKSFILCFLILLLLSANLLIAQENSKITLDKQKVAHQLLNVSKTNLPSTLRVKTHAPQQFLVWAKDKLPSLSILEFSKDSTLILIESKNAKIIQLLLESEEVLFIDVGLRQAYTERSNDLEGFRVNRVGVLHSQFPELNGMGLNVSVKEEAFDKNDIDFRGQIPLSNSFPSNNTTHATEMASLIAGGGNSSPLGKGVAWQADLFTSDFINLLPDDTDEFMNQEISIQNHSYGVGIENYYGIETQAYDAQAINYPELLHIFSAGNSGNRASTEGVYTGITGFANLTAQFKMSKNTLSVGEIDGQNQITTLSSRGPAYDGRIKPELVAYGGAGSSESAALASGISLLVQQAYLDEYGNLPPASLVKATLINSSEDLGRLEVDYEYGFGKVNALEAVKSIKNQEFIQGSLQHQEEKTYHLQVPEGAGLMKISLVWHDPAAMPNAPKALINDLDLSLKNINATQTWLPWVLSSFPHPDSLTKLAVRKEDHLNNIEQITVYAPEAGEYQIKVKGFLIESETQSFSVVYSYENSSQWLYPSQSDFLIADRVINLEWKARSIIEEGIIELKYTEGEDWLFLGEVANVSQGTFSYLLPDTLALIQFRVRSTSLILTSEIVTVAQPIVPKVGFDCPEEVLLSWTPIKGIEEYEVFAMGGKYLEPYRLVNDTLIVINKNQTSNVYFSVAPVFETRNPKGLTLNYNFQSLDCYIRSLLLLDIVNDTIRLDLQLGTNYRLSSVALQRKESGVFQNIQTLNTPEDTRLLLNDNQPLLYRNVYRVELTNVQGQKFYSNEVEAFYVPNNEYYVFPNPAKAGETVVLIDEKEEIENILIYNVQGIKLREFEISEVFKEIGTDNLQPGMYFLYLSNSLGKKAIKRLVIY
jgi:hypothetical protein